MDARTSLTRLREQFESGAREFPEFAVGITDSPYGPEFAPWKQRGNYPTDADDSLSGGSTSFATKTGYTDFWCRFYFVDRSERASDRVFLHQLLTGHMDDQVRQWLQQHAFAPKVAVDSFERLSCDAMYLANSIGSPSIKTLSDAGYILKGENGWLLGMTLIGLQRPPGSLLRIDNLIPRSETRYALGMERGIELYHGSIELRCSFDLARNDVEFEREAAAKSEGCFVSYFNPFRVSVWMIDLLRDEVDGSDGQIAPENVEIDQVTLACALLTTYGPNKLRIAKELGIPRTSMTGKKWERFNQLYDKLKKN